MNWSKAKNIAIIAFLLLNILLVGLLRLDARQYALAAQSQQAITAVLAKNNITLAQNFDFVRHDPIRRLALFENNFNRNALANLLMIYKNDILMTIESDYTKFHNELEEVRFYNDGIVRYTNLGNVYRELQTKSEMRMFATNLMRSLGEDMRSFVLDTSHEKNDNTLVLEYRQMYRGNIVYSNFLIFTFKNGNISTIDFSFSPVDGFLGSVREMRPSDEILLTFMRNIEGYAIIKEMDIVHKAWGQTATPYYRITYMQHDQLNTMLINGYTNSLGNP